MTDTPADERCESCHRLDPINCPCPPEEIQPDTVLTLPFVTHETDAVVEDVVAERVRQVAKWGVQTRPDGTRRNGDEDDWAAHFKAKTDQAAADGSLTWRDILNEEVAEAYAETEQSALRTELVQVAAVALAWVEDIDRKGGAEAASDRALAALREKLGPDSRVARDISSGRLPLRQPGSLPNGTPADDLAHLVAEDSRSAWRGDDE